MQDAGDIRLTERQLEVLRLIDERLTIKVIAARLNVTESAINQHIKTLKLRVGVATQKELADWYNASRASARRFGDLPQPDVDCSKTASRKKQLPAIGCDDENPGQNSPMPVFGFQDVQSFRLDAPWTRSDEPRVVPGLLDGRNAGWVRAAVIVGLVFAIFASIIVAVAAALALTEVVPRL